MSGLPPWRRLLEYRGALWLLASRNLKLRYRRSMLGFAWTLAYPALATAVLSLVFAGVFESVAHYPAYVVVGILAWHFFSVSCSQAMDALLAGAPVLRNVQVPTALFPLAAVSANVANLALCIAVLPTALAVFGAGGALRPLPFVLGLASLVTFTAGAALALAALNVFFRDVRYFFEALLLVWFYATPIVYPSAALPHGAQWLLALNPLAWIVEAVRSGLCDASPPEAATLVAALGCGSVSLIVGWRLYLGVEQRFHLYW
jgi:ABC-type polysaccharide/polyol phosphate export permease